MSEENQKKLFGISAIICIILLTITYFGDLAISNTLINYHSWVGTFLSDFWRVSGLSYFCLMWTDYDDLCLERRL